MTGRARHAVPPVAGVLALVLSAGVAAAQSAKNVEPVIASQPLVVAEEAPPGRSLNVAAGAAVGVLIGAVILVALVSSGSD